jgi:hypothetical protein
MQIAGFNRFVCPASNAGSTPLMMWQERAKLLTERPEQDRPSALFLQTFPSAVELRLSNAEFNLQARVCHSLVCLFSESLRENAAE